MKITILVVLLLVACAPQSKTPPKLAEKPVEPDLLFIEELPLEEANPAPIIVMLHGFRDNERGLISLAQQLDPEFFVIGARAPIVVEPDQYAWYPLGENAVTEKDRAVRGVVRLINDLPRTSERQNKTATDKRAPVFLAGFSQGGAMALMTAAKAEPGQIQGVIAFSPAQFSVEKIDVPVFITHGKHDPVVPYTSIEEATERLKQTSDVTFVTFEGTHTIPPVVVEKAQAWLSGLGSGDR